MRINSFGVFILFLYPGAFVELHTDHLEVISPLRKLRIFTSGVWHNVVLALLAYLGLCSIPYMILPLFRLESGVAVTWIDEVRYRYSNYLSNKLSFFSYGVRVNRKTRFV